MKIARKSLLAATSGIAALMLSACAQNSPVDALLNKVQSDFAAINAKSEQDRAEIRARQQQGNAGMGNVVARPDDNAAELVIPLTIPKDKKVGKAVEEALPTIKKIIALHQCMKNKDGLRQMNFYAVPGVDMTRVVSTYAGHFPMERMQFHDRNKCLRVQSMDQFSMPALNALLFRAVYFADDSGETSNFLYLFMRADDGSWQIKKFERS